MVVNLRGLTLGQELHFPVGAYSGTGQTVPSSFQSADLEHPATTLAAFTAY